MTGLRVVHLGNVFWVGGSARDVLGLELLSQNYVGWIVCGWEGKSKKD